MNKKEMNSFHDQNIMTCDGWEAVVELRYLKM